MIGRFLFLALLLVPAISARAETSPKPVIGRVCVIAKFTYPKQSFPFSADTVSRFEGEIGKSTANAVRRRLKLLATDGCPVGPNSKEFRVYAEMETERAWTLTVRLGDALPIEQKFERLFPVASPSRDELAAFGLKIEDQLVKAFDDATQLRIYDQFIPHKPDGNHRLERMAITTLCPEASLPSGNCAVLPIDMKVFGPLLESKFEWQVITAGTSGKLTALGLGMCIEDHLIVSNEAREPHDLRLSSTFTVENLRLKEFSESERPCGKPPVPTEQPKLVTNGIGVFE